MHAATVVSVQAFAVTVARAWAFVMVNILFYPAGGHVVAKIHYGETVHSTELAWKGHWPLVAAVVMTTGADAGSWAFCWEEWAPVGAASILGLLTRRLRLTTRRSRLPSTSSDLTTMEWVNISVQVVVVSSAG